LFSMWEKSTDGTSAEVMVKPKRVFEGAHAYNINSVSFNSDGETFISSDDLRINLWHVGIAEDAFSAYFMNSLILSCHSPTACVGVVDIKPDNMDELTEVITCSTFHPNQCTLLIYATSKGIIRMGDLRNSALCNTYAKGNI